MSPCSEIRELLAAHADGELDRTTAARVERHLEGCAECSETVKTLALIADATADMSRVEPPPHLESAIASSPCTRWLVLLFRAIDHEIGEANLGRLLTHMQGCEPCRRTWQDLTLIHQLGEAVAPPQHLLFQCISVRRAVRQVSVVARRTAVAAAYILAVLASLLIGSPATQVRANQASETVQRLADAVGGEVSEVAASSQGELKVMLWRSWQWAADQADTAQAMILKLTDSLASEASTDDDTDESKETDHGHDNT
jgi:predicted anti-sigma-YlaC factor YlaD